VNFTVDVKTVLCEFFVFEKCEGGRRRLDLGNILKQKNQSSDGRGIVFIYEHIGESWVLQSTLNLDFSK
jgi:hypothetical protein